jgi:hypothetical protein
MLVDALVVFVEVVVWLVLMMSLLWGLTKVLGYAAMLFEREPVVPEIKQEVADTRRQIQRTFHRGQHA